MDDEEGVVQTSSRMLRRMGHSVVSLTDSNQAMLLLRIYPPQWNLPIVVKAAVVRWVRGLDFGVEFLNIDTEVQAEVRRLLQELQAQDNMPG